MPETTSKPATSYPPGKEEKPLLVIHRHSFGLIILYLQASLGVVAAMVMIYFLVTGFVDEGNRTRIWQLFGVLGLVALVMTALVLAAATYIYTQTKMIISKDSLTQFLQTGLLSRRISKLNLSHIEDVTAVQSGLFPRILNFGTLNVETAAEEENFHFTFCPDPNKCAQVILDAHHTASAVPNNNPRIN